MRLPARRRLPLLGLTGILTRRYVVLALLSGLGGLAEAVVLVLIVQIALRVAQESPDTGAAGLLSTGDWSLSTLFALAASLAVARFVLLTAAGWLGASISTQVIQSARKQLFSAFVRADWRVQSAEEEGRLQDLTTTQMGYAALYALVVAAVLTSGVSFLTLLVTAVIVNPIAAVTMVVVAALLFAGLRPLSKMAKQQSRAQAASTREYGRSISQAVNLALEARVFNVTKEFERRLNAAADQVATVFFRGQMLGRLVPTIYQSLALLLIVGALWFLYELEAGAIAGVGAVVILLIRALAYGQLLQGGYNELQYYLPYAENVERAIVSYRTHEATGGRRTSPALERLELDSVGFSYDGVADALTDVSFEVARGEIVGIAGSSGAGKSTLVEILLRLRSPTTGRYLVNGSPADESDLDSWFSRLAIVRQEPRLLTGSVEENIRFLREGISDEDVVRAAELAHLHQGIVDRPGGYNAAIGERGSALSGGQRQRLTIARAIAGGPELVVLDEPTSALDMYAESVIQETLHNMRGRATVFVVAHRPSTLRICDRIMVLEAGRLKAFDTPDVLAKTSPFFKQALELARLA
jgi:ABC-type multidrug transport system fused ATPase/permease subunit